MIKKILVTLLLSVAVSQSAVKELIPNLTSGDLDVRTQARLDLLAVCSDAGKPGNEQACEAVCKEICGILETDQPAVAVMHQMLLNLERIGSAESVPTLAKMLNHKEEYIRDDARRALAVNPSADATQALGAQLKMRKAGSTKETAGFIQALGERRSAGASKLIVGSLGSKDQEIFISAVKALGWLAEPEGIKALTAQRAKEEGFRKTQVEAALFATGNTAVLEAFYADSEPEQIRSIALLGLILKGDIAKASKAMTSGIAGLQIAVIEAALQGKNEAVYGVVAANVENLIPHIQLQAVAALEFSENRSYAKAVERLLKSDDVLVQDNASRALARIGTAESVPALLANGRGTAKTALGQVNDEGVDQVLEANAASGAYRASAIEALANRGRVDLIPVFLKYGAEDDRAVASAAVKAIGDVGDNSSLDVLAGLMIAQEASPVSRDALNAIVTIMRRSMNQKEGVDVLVGKMNGASARSQSNILMALAATGSAAALKPLSDSCLSADEQLQKTAVKALGGWNDKNGIPTMLELAADESVSLTNHVILMRGVTRLYAAEKSKNLKKDQIQQAIDVCRRDDEAAVLKELYDKAK